MTLPPSPGRPLATRPNRPLEWTGRQKVRFDSNSFVPATQGQRSAYPIISIIKFSVALGFLCKLLSE